MTAGYPSRLVVMTQVGIALLMWSAVVLRAAPVGVQPAVKPHFDPARCGECHRMVEGKAAPIEAGGVDRICLRCHDGRAAAGEAHPVGRELGKGRSVPVGWPLVEGRIGCITCHDVKVACSLEAKDSLLTAKLLRQLPDGAPKTLFCDRCHGVSEFVKFNPHLMLTADRAVIEERCLVCHTEKMDRGAKARVGQPSLRGGETAICRSCHAQHPDQFQPGHMGAKVKPEMQAFMRAREVIGLTKAPGPEMIAQFKKAGAKPELIGLAAGSTITCTTCHNPHQAGVFPPLTALAYRPMRVQGGRAVSQVRGDQFCSQCHEL